MRRIALSLLILALGLGAGWGQDAPRVGLIWNHSGLPATLPLQVRSPEGADHVIFLTRDGASTPEVAGFFHGGAFFRLLVPPGDWRIRIASGRAWQGEAALFGPETAWRDLPQPLHFGAGKSRLNGHALTLTDDAITVAPRPSAACPAGIRACSTRTSPLAASRPNRSPCIRRAARPRPTRPRPGSTPTRCAIRTRNFVCGRSSAIRWKRTCRNRRTTRHWGFRW